MRFVRNLPLLESFEVKRFRSDPWNIKTLYLRNACGENSLRMMISGVILGLFLLVGGSIVPGQRPLLAILYAALLLGAVLGWLTWTIIAACLARKRYRSVIAAIEQTVDGIHYVNARAEYESILRLSQGEGAGHLYKNRLNSLRSKVVELWQVAIDNSGYCNVLYESKLVLLSEPPKEDPALLEAIAALDQSMNDKLKLHRDSRQELRQL